MLSVLRASIAQPRIARGIHISAIRFAYPLSKQGKPLQPYMRFSKEMRPEVLKRSPELKLPDVGRELGRLWRELSDAEREQYRVEYLEAKKK